MSRLADYKNAMVERGAALALAETAAQAHRATLWHRAASHLRLAEQMLPNLESLVGLRSNWLSAIGLWEERASLLERAIRPGDVIQHHRSKRIRWKVLAVMEDGTLHAERIPDGRERDITRPEYYRKVRSNGL